MDSSRARLAALAIALVGATSIMLGARAALPLLRTATVTAPPDASQVELTIVLLVAGFWLFVGGLGMVSRPRSRQRR